MIVLEQKNSNIGNEDNFKQRKFNKTIILKYKSLAVKQFFLFPSIILFQRFWFYLSLFAFRSIPPFPINCTRRRGGKVKLNVSTKLGKRFPHEERARAHYPSTLREQAEYELLLWRMTSCKRKSIVIGLVFGYLDETHASFTGTRWHRRTYNVCDADSDNFYQLLATCVQLVRVTMIYCA